MLKSRLNDNHVFGMDETINDILIENGKRVCSCIHPDYPELLEYPGNARGRKIHLDSGDEIHTVCNMLVDEYISKDKYSQPCIVDNGKCKICFKAGE